MILKVGAQIEVPGLDHAALAQIFEAHTRFTESESQLPSLQTNTMQHSSEQTNLPDLSPDILEKMTSIAKTLGLDDTSALPVPELNCNCIYCQVLRALGKTIPVEEEITEADLHFRDWEIKQTADTLYSVTNPLDRNEQYSVFLGTPIGCTCGQKSCEHIKAVLNS